MSAGVMPASAIAFFMQPMMGLPSGLERVRWKIVRHLAAAFHHAENARAARQRVVEAFQHQRAGAFRHHKAITVLGEGTGGFFRLLVGRGQRGEQGEADKGFRVHRTIGTKREGHLAVTAPDGFHTELDGRGARGAGGGERNGLALRGRTGREAIGYGAEQEALVPGANLPLAADSRNVAILDRAMG